MYIEGRNKELVYAQSWTKMLNDLV